MNFEILRDMEAFTQKMFNNIIGFQEKEHAAWNEKLSFEERIKEIPLHYLIFSNADRDPETHGPTIAHYYPLQREMALIAQYANAVSSVPIVVDAHARNGFIGSLLARENVKVIGLKDVNEKPNQIENFYDKDRYELRESTLDQIEFDVDVVFSSWMPSGTDDTAAIAKIRPKLVVYVFSEHVDENTQLRQVGVEGAFGENLPPNYKLIDEWTITRQKDLLREVWPDLTGSIEETRIVRIYADEAWHDLNCEQSYDPALSYAWEHDLLVTETAYQAKMDMVARGFPVNV